MSAAAAVDRALAALPPGPVAIAVSGGSDSLALLDLVVLRAGDRPVLGVTLNHGLRPEAADEAAMVAQICAERGVPHTILHWTGWDGAGNLQAAAREARYGLIGAWAAGQGVAQVWLGHTRDDVAETLLIRLGRAAGLDGLARMAPLFQRAGVTWARPLLDIPRADLRAHLGTRGMAWAEDPSNADDSYARARVRKGMAGLGLDAAALAHSAAALADARSLVTEVMAREWAACVTVQGGDLLIRAPDAGPEVLRRLLVAALRVVGGQAWPVRHAALADLRSRLEGGGRHTLAGCLVTRKGATWRIAREWQAVRDLTGPTTAPWDHRWHLHGPHHAGLTVRALGQGIALCPDWRAAGLPRSSQLAGPAIWMGDRLIAAPLAGLGPDWAAELRPSFAKAPFAH